MPKVGNKDYTPLSQTVKQAVSEAMQTKKKEEDKELSSFIAIEPEWSIDEIVLDSTTQNSLLDAIEFCKHRQKIVEDWNLKRFLKGSGGCTGINMYGKPGTGKSIAAEAIAKASEKKLIKVDYSEIQNERWGGTEKKLTELFETAKQLDAVIFFDEADGLLGKRQSGGANSETNNQIKSHLLTLLDSSNVIVVFATNLFENYDRAFFRRILFHISFPLPDVQQLKSLWEFHLGDENGIENVVPRTKDFSFEELANDSLGLSGGDIKNLTLKSCIRLVSRNIPELNNNMLREEIIEYKQSLADMNIQKSSGKRVEILEGKDKEEAQKLFEKQTEQNNS